jgi:TetR/AcrR family transcriptional regulator
MTEGHISNGTEAKRRLIVKTAMRHFAEHGYAAARVDAIASDLGIAKGSIFAHFGSKGGLFVAAYRRAAEALPAWLDAPEAVRELGFFAVMRYWLERTEHLVVEDWVPYRVVLIGNYGSDLTLRRDINRFLVSEDPYGTLDFVEFGIARGEVRSDIDPELIASMVDWLQDRFQDALVTDEMDPGLFRRRSGRAADVERRVREFTTVVRSGIGTEPC